MDGCDYNALEVKHYEQRSIHSEKQNWMIASRGKVSISYTLMPGVYCQNLWEVCTLVAESNAAIVCVTETWLDDSVMDSEIELSGYVVQRKDLERSGGSVCMYIRSDFAFNPCPERSTNQLETLWI